jgi:hypothetical protein
MILDGGELFGISVHRESLAEFDANPYSDLWFTI